MLVGGIEFGEYNLANRCLIQVMYMLVHGRADLIVQNRPTSRIIMDNFQLFEGLVVDHVLVVLGGQLLTMFVARMLWALTAALSGIDL